MVGPYTGPEVEGAEGAAAQGSADEDLGGATEVVVQDGERKEPFIVAP
jgi:hypothetical protein